MTIKQKKITTATVHDLFTFAEKNYGVSWNCANGLFFHDVIEYGKINVIDEVDVADNISYFGDRYDEYFDDNLSQPIKERSYKDIPREYHDSSDAFERGHIILLAFLQENGITGELWLEP